MSESKPTPSDNGRKRRKTQLSERAARYGVLVQTSIGLATVAKALKMEALEEEWSTRAIRLAAKLGPMVDRLLDGPPAKDGGKNGQH